MGRLRLQPAGCGAGRPRRAAGRMSYWSDLVDAAVLGSGRTAPPHPLSGPLADLADGAGLLDLASAASRARRAGYRPGDAAAQTAPEPAPPDDRPLVRVAARRRL